MKLTLIVVALLALHATADVYMQHPRASNNRLDDENRDRNNANRLFDSQNNNRGGYNVGSVYYYAGSKVNVDWTVQHSCGNPNNNCEMIFQYMCDPLIRDGSTTNTIPDDPNQCVDNNCDTDVRYGRHESYQWYQECKYRTRNTGLFTSSQDLNGNDARFTRQNPNGARRGYECPEERDYYPYWFPSPWVDVAVFTNTPQRCDSYKALSRNSWSGANVLYYCDVPEYIQYVMMNQRGWWPIDQASCETDPNLQNIINEMTNESESAVWRAAAAWGVDEPDCHDNQWSRDNHHGNVEGGHFAAFNWTVPKDFISEQCVLRVRYNISTGDYEEWVDDETAQANDVNANLNHLQNGADRFPAYVDIWTQYGLTEADNAASFDANLNNNDATERPSREYVVKNNPKVDFFKHLIDGTETGTTKANGNQQLKFQLAVNTAQYGRTFQDRTHTFGIRTTSIDATIHNLQVRGKRGNIVQNYPATEYDFASLRLHAQVNSYIHFQWTGSNTNPNNNAGQGRQGSDRHNAVLLREANHYERGLTGEDPERDENGDIIDPENAGPWTNEVELQGVDTVGHWGNSYPARIDTGASFFGLSWDEMYALALAGSPEEGGQNGGELSELDDAGTYFDLGPKKATDLGVYHYLCTRNNNFSNRDQKAKIVVSYEASESALIGELGGSVSTSSATISFAPGEISIMTITLSEAPKSTPSSLSDVSSHFITVNPFDLGGGRFTAKLDYDNMPLGTDAVYHSNDYFGTWGQIGNAKFSSGVATFTASEGGLYAVTTTTNWGAVVGIAIAVAVVLGGALFFGFRWYRNKNAGHSSSINAVA
jgi:hypothetical protein